MIRSYVLASVLAVAATFSSARAEGAGPEFWIGHAERNGTVLPFQIRLVEGKTVNGALDVPEFSRLGMPLLQSERGSSRMTLGFGEIRLNHLFEGKRKGDRYEGTWHWVDENFECRFVLERKPDPRPYTSEDVSFENGDVTLSGTVFIPKTPGPHPGIMMMPGSGNSPRWHWEGHADFFARQGLVALMFDKRGSGKSTGDWKQSGFDELAQDGLAGIQLLQKRKEVDPKRVGFWGISQAGWIMPLAATKSPEVAFILTTSGPAVDVKTEGKYDYLVRLRDAGVSGEDLALAERILDMDHEVTMTSQGYNELRTLMDEAREKPWWKTFEFQLVPVAARAFPKLIGGFDPRPVLEEVKVPILWMYGLADKSVEPTQNIAILNEIMTKQPKPWTIKTFPDADHGIQLKRDGSAPFPHRAYAPGYWDTMAEWVKQLGK
jgi:dienelactone hydrolase